MIRRGQTEQGVHRAVKEKREGTSSTERALVEHRTGRTQRRQDEKNGYRKNTYSTRTAQRGQREHREGRKNTEETERAQGGEGELRLNRESPDGTGREHRDDRESTVRT